MSADRSADERGEDAADEEPGAEPGRDVEGVVGADVDAAEHHQDGE